MMTSNSSKNQICKGDHQNKQAKKLIYNQKHVQNIRKGKMSVSTKALDLQFLWLDPLASIEGQLHIHQRLKSLIRVMRHAKRLHELDLYTSPGLLLTDKALSFLSKALEGSIFLQGLHLYFSNSSRITNTGLEGISRTLQRLTLLRTLSLSFANCCQITRLDSLSKCLKRLRVLKKISLKLLSCQNLDDEGLCSFGKSFKRLRFLQKIYLKFEGCAEITDRGFQSFGVCIIELSSLKSININFNRCLNITEKGKKHSEEKHQEAEKMILDSIYGENDSQKKAFMILYGMGIILYPWKLFVGYSTRSPFEKYVLCIHYSHPDEDLLTKLIETLKKETLKIGVYDSVCFEKRSGSYDLAESQLSLSRTQRIFQALKFKPLTGFKNLDSILCI